MNRRTSSPVGSRTEGAGPVAWKVMRPASAGAACAHGHRYPRGIAAATQAEPGSGGCADHVRELVVGRLDEDLSERRDDHRDGPVPGIVHQLLRGRVGLE